MKVVVPIYVWLNGALERITLDSPIFAPPPHLARIGFADDGGMFVRGLTEQRLYPVKVGRSFTLKPKERRKLARTRVRGRRGSMRIGYKYEFRCVINMLDITQKNEAVRELAKQIPDPIATAGLNGPHRRYWPDGWSALYTHAEEDGTKSILQRAQEFMRIRPWATQGSK